MGNRGALAVCVGICAVALFGAPGPPCRGFPAIGPAHAQEDWRKEFDDVCSRTQDAMVLSSDELKSLVARCETLKGQIEKLDESQRKVFSKRLQLCRDLYVFVLESREKKP